MLGRGGLSSYWGFPAFAKGKPAEGQKNFQAGVASSSFTRATSSFVEKGLVT